MSRGRAARDERFFTGGRSKRVLSVTRTRGAAAAFVDARLGVNNLDARGVCFNVVDPTRGVGGAGVGARWNWNGRWIRSRLRLILPQQSFFAIVARHTNELAGANLARAPLRRLGFSTRRDAAPGPEVRRLRETHEVRISIQSAIRRDYRDGACFECIPLIPSTSCTARRPSLRRHPSMFSSRWICFYRTRTSHTSVRRAPAKEREESGVNHPDETEIAEANVSGEWMEMDVHYLATSARRAEPVARFELRCPPPADFGFVLITLGASAIVGALRREK